MGFELTKWVSNGNKWVSNDKNGFRMKKWVPNCKNMFQNEMLVCLLKKLVYTSHFWLKSSSKPSNNRFPALDAQKSHFWASDSVETGFASTNIEENTLGHS